MKTNLEAYLLAAKIAGCPQDQVKRFIEAGYIATPTQLQFHSYARQCDNDNDINDLLLAGTRGSVKSHAVIAQVGIDDCQRVPSLKWLFLRKTHKAASESFEDLTNRVLKNVPCKVASNAVDYPNKSKIIIGGYEDENDIDKYIGIEYDGLVIEERTQLKGEKIDKLYGSIRTSKTNWRPRKYSSTNPGGRGHVDCFKTFVMPFRNNAQKNTRYVHCTYKDNPFIDSGYKNWLEGLTGYLKKIWCDGSWDVTEGQFFTMFGEHNKERPFIIPDDSYGRVWLSLDHGITHNTSAGVWFLDNELTMHRVCSYCQNGGTTEGHATTIWDMVDSSKWLNGVWPDTIYFDPSMETKRKLSESLYQSDIDIYKNVFGAKEQSKNVQFLPANNRRADGCHIMQDCFQIGKGKAKVFYFAELNQTFEDGIKRVLVDENNTEQYEKADGDDEADEARYGIVAGYSRINHIIKNKKSVDVNRVFAEAVSGGSWMGV